MSKRKLSDSEFDEISEQMKRLRKRLRKFNRVATEEVREPPIATIITQAQTHTEDKENDLAAVVTSKDLVEEDASEESSSKPETSDFDEEVRTAEVEDQKIRLAIEVTKEEIADMVMNLSNETRERLCLKTEPAQSSDMLVAEC
ncbi:uncharacterized protein LOC105188278 [Harpegnathos saltator]|uniref:uncharacterized protein LOC105188278 n=1 Tax=Harpegnathos saltator TaxID=610380 RepID=UPI000948A326|nr:uncharacterized protein LOC105188278 [Harpegnathos saltator]